MTELNVLRALLLWALALAPLASHRRLLPASPLVARGHAVALTCAAIGLFSSAPVLCGVWLVFCLVAFALFLWQRRTQLRSPYVLACCVPFVFSIIAAVWLVGGANELRILGFGVAFSYYAALHGNVLGWMLLGSVAILARPDNPQRKLHLASVFVSFVSFLIVAVGISHLPAIKPLGVLGFSVMIPLSQLAFLRRVRTTHTGAFILGCVSVLALAFTMTLAWQHEVGVLSIPEFLSTRPMVSVHGIVNGVIVAPCFLLAVVLDARASDYVAGGSVSDTVIRSPGTSGQPPPRRTNASG